MTYTPLTRAGLVLGVGGFFDGIVLHQILQWHHLVCFTPDRKPTSVEMLKQQNTQDGYFRLAVWILALIGIGLLFRAARQPDTPWTANAFVGSVLAGWGVFNFVEGLIDHQILGIHHVLPGPHQFAADMTAGRTRTSFEFQHTVWEVRGEVTEGLMVNPQAGKSGLTRKPFPLRLKTWLKK